MGICDSPIVHLWKAQYQTLESLLPQEFSLRHPRYDVSASHQLECDTYEEIKVKHYDPHCHKDFL